MTDFPRELGLLFGFGWIWHAQRDMRLGVDARMMGPETARGIGRVVAEFVSAGLATDPETTFVLWEQSTRVSLFAEKDRVIHVKADVRWYSLREQLVMPFLLRKEKVDLLFFPHWNVPVFCFQPFAFFLHDLILLHQADSTKVSLQHPWKAKLKYLGFCVTLWLALRRATWIFTPTHFVAEEVRRRFPWAAAKTCVVGEGVTALPPPTAVEAAKSPFLLVVGSAYPHKRLDLLIKAWPTLKVNRPTLHLVFVGERDVFMQRLQESAEYHKLKDVQFLGRATDAELADLYPRAELLVFPSSDEGFGLPPLEALSLGCPVVSSDAGSLPEVLPRVGVRFFRSGDKDDMIRVIDQALRDRPRLLKDMPDAQRDLRRHDWQRMAHRLLERLHATVQPSFPR
jgi:glycosyltransferase involved in cell wall biosynthesis